MQRKQLKQQLILERSFCDFCGFELGLAVDMHEWLIKRSALPKNNKIMDPRNCALLHTNCHAKFGQTKQMRQALAPIFIERYGKQKMLEFISDLNLRAPQEYINLIHMVE